MSKSVKNVFEETIKKFCGDVSHQLSSWLEKEKNVDISPEEICSFFDVTYKPPSTPGLPSGSAVQTKMPNLPDYYAGTGVSPAKKRGGGRSKKVVDPDAPVCEYITTRGQNPGTRCSKQVANDGSKGSDRFCKQCLKKAAVKAIIEGPATKSTVQPPVLQGGVVKMPEEPKNEPQNDELQVIEIEGHPGKYREVNHGFIVQQGEDGSLTSHQIDDPNSGWRDLKENEKKIALSLGIQVVHTSSLPKVPQITQ